MGIQVMTGLVDLIFKLRERVGENPMKPNQPTTKLTYLIESTERIKIEKKTANCVLAKSFSVSAI